MRKRKKDRDFDVDLVYLWVDGNDPEWRKKHNAMKGIEIDDPSEDCAGRYANNDELKYSLRAVEKYAPWIHRIFIVTDSQIPSWIDTSDPRIRIVDHTEILPPEALPTFNSCIIEQTLFRIPDLSEHFLYSNDDMFFNRPVEKSDFFTADGLPIIRFIRRPFRKFSLWYRKNIRHKHIDYYNHSIHLSALLVESKFGKYITDKPHHNIDAYCKSLYTHTFEVFRNEIEPTLVNHLRSENDIQRSIYSYLPVVENKCRVMHVNMKTSYRLHIHRHRHYDRMKRFNPMFFCVNDSEYASDNDRRIMREFLDARFPEKSCFEKS